ncbi:ventricular zone-expressed PH domain-containing protein 1-like [Tubulanus polymorphus]|uniref:ventricular zone-expressed PH domain-containing protein 1-like n=1 Tax=Tubulanus polymorphus TaxID=672921 RepID=UPI003DA428FB
MHELLEDILKNRDLSKAGDIFSIEYTDLLQDVGEVLVLIEEIIDSSEYETNDNDQSVVEICITWVTSNIRDNDTINEHCAALVKLLECCLNYNLNPRNKDEDPAHGKIACDLFSCIFPKNYSRHSVMELALPVAVRYLQHDNTELCRHVTSYLTLAATENNDILATQLTIILHSILNGNHSLCRILPNLYPENKQPINDLITKLIELLPKCEEIAEKTALINTFILAAKQSPDLLVNHVDVLMTLLSNIVFTGLVLEIFTHIVVLNIEAFIEYLPKLKTIAGQQTTVLPAVIKLISAVGSSNQCRAEECLLWLVEQLAEADLNNLTLLLQEIKSLGELYTDLVTGHIGVLVKYEQHSSSASSLISQIRDLINSKGDSAGGKEVKSISVQTDIEEDGVLLDSISTAKASGSPSESPTYADSLSESPHSNGGTQNNNLPVRDSIQHFCDKHLDKIKSYIGNVSHKLPIPCKASVEERKSKRRLCLQFSCSGCSPHCLYSGNYFYVKTKMPKTWIHIMFLSEQAKSPCALSQSDPTVALIKSTWDKLRLDTFTQLVFSAFPSQKEQDLLLRELHGARFFDMFMFNATLKVWCCFTCDDPEKLSDLLQDGAPVIEGQLKEKKGRWNFFKRWKTRYFTLSGAQITYSKSDSRKATLPVSKIQSVKAIRHGTRDIPKAFEIFTNDDQKYILKGKDGKNTEQWVQCLHIAVAQSHKEDGVIDLTDQSPSCSDPQTPSRSDPQSHSDPLSHTDPQTNL